MDLIKFINKMNIGDEITLEELTQFTDRFENGKIIKPKIGFSDLVDLSETQKNILKLNKMTVGRLIFNLFCLPEEYVKQFGAVNDTITSKNYETIHSNLAILLTDGIIDSDKYSDTIDRISWLGLNMTNFRGKCMDFDSIDMSDKFMKKKESVYKELKARNATGDEILAAEDELIADAKNEKKDSGLVHIINSGSKGSFTNNYKVLNIGRGIIKNGAGEIVLLDRSLAEGNKPSDYVQLSNNSILGTYGRSMKTAQGGYLTKLVTSGFSYINIDKDNIDCGTKGFLIVKITKDNYKEYLHRNIRFKGREQWVSMTLNNYKDFLDKEVEMRSPMFCHSKDGICPTCYGGLYNINKIDKGLSVIITDLTSKIMNTSMKSVASAYSDICIKQCELSGKLSA